MLGLILSLIIIVFLGGLRRVSSLCLILLILGLSPWRKVFEEWLSLEKITWAIAILTLILLIYCISSINKSFELWILTLACRFFFLSNSAVIFYFSYEAILLPVVWLLLKSGREPERLISAIYIVGYTFVGTLPMLICGMILINKESSQRIFILSFRSLPIWYFILIRLTFLVKLPLWGVHRWLPLAHVYSPIVGRIILAGIILKAGAYGLHLRFRGVGCRRWVLFLLARLGLVGSLLSFYSGTKQSDLKAIIAFSSIMHIGVCLPILAQGSVFCQAAVLSILVGHGLASPVLFRVATSLGGMFNTRIISYVKILPLISFSIIGLVAVSLAFNAGFPPTLNFIAETIGMVCCWNLSLVFCVIFSLVFLVGGLYGIYIWVTIQSPSSITGVVCIPSWKDIWALWLLAILRSCWPIFVY